MFVCVYNCTVGVELVTVCLHLRSKRKIKKRIEKEKEYEVPGSEKNQGMESSRGAEKN